MENENSNNKMEIVFYHLNETKHKVGLGANDDLTEEENWVILAFFREKPELKISTYVGL